MAIVVEGLDQLDATLDRMLKKLQGFPDAVVEELTDWQRADMRRQHPNIERPDANTIETDIWPRSRTYRYKPTGRQVGRPSGPDLRPRATAVAPRAPSSRTPSMRPILRETLLEVFDERMTNLLGTLTWD
jgi:hypothetical protein